MTVKVTLEFATFTEAVKALTKLEVEGELNVAKVQTGPTLAPPPAVPTQTSVAPTTPAPASFATPVAAAAPASNPSVTTPATTEPEVATTATMAAAKLAKEQERVQVKAELDAMNVEYNGRLGLTKLKDLLAVAKVQGTAPAAAIPEHKAAAVGDLGVLFREVMALYADSNVGQSKCFEIANKFGAAKFSDITEVMKPQIAEVLKAIKANPSQADAIIANINPGA